MSQEQVGAQMRAQLQRIDPYEFENFVADIWEVQGWSTEVSQASNDRGVDVVASKSGTVAQKMAIQVKRYSEGNKVGRPEIQQYYSLKEQDRDSDAAVVVTTSEFTRDAQLWAYDHNVKLVDGDDLVDLLQKYDCEYLIDEYELEEVEEISSEDQGSTEEKDVLTASKVLNNLFSKEESILSSTPVTTWVPMILVTLAIWSLSIAAMGLISSDGVFLLGLLFATVSWLFLPVTLFMDATELHRKKAAYRPNRVTWPLFAFGFGGFAVLFYLIRRTINIKS